MPSTCQQPKHRYVVVGIYGDRSLSPVHAGNHVVEEGVGMGGSAQGYFDTSLQTFDLFGAGDREKNRERKKWIDSEEEERRGEERRGEERRGEERKGEERRGEERRGEERRGEERRGEEKRGRGDGVCL
ncbi:RNA-binding protein 4F [Nibea albiflora]|uniref:RNA-binding protein 4F n=1 Tax=Nibea albiflora TaxID=240163 RepID=A0ACB7EH48_NIBAL|nr:RNA-binding protein 4F [Nibea albiflora]